MKRDSASTTALKGLTEELREIERQFSAGDLLNDRNALGAAAQRHKKLSKILALASQLDDACEEAAAAEELLGEVTADESGEARELREMLEDANSRISALNHEISLLLTDHDGNEDKNVIVEIRGAEGGEEANLFARDLFGMYRAFAERRGWKVEVLGVQHSDLGGISEAAFQLSGKGVWGAMQFEAGPHRVQRVPVTESQGRVHTSSATVAVLPVADEVEVNIDEADLQVDVFRSSGPGGQSVNTTDSAVRVTHLPTGLVVSMQDEKSQLQNRNKAMRVLRARLLRIEQERQTAAEADRRRSQLGRGGRSEKIRTYNFKENRVSDHRIRLTLYKLDRVLAGELNVLTDALAEAERERVLAEAGAGGARAASEGRQAEGDAARQAKDGAARSEERAASGAAASSSER